MQCNFITCESEELQIKLVKVLQANSGKCKTKACIFLENYSAEFEDIKESDGKIGICKFLFYLNKSNMNIAKCGIACVIAQCCTNSSSELLCALF